MTGDPAAELFEELAPGGLSNHWACAVPRFAPDDFADAARAGEAHAWPIDYAELAPWYDRVEPLLHIAGSRRDVPRLPANSVSNTWALSPEWDPVIAAAATVGRDVVAMPYAYGAGTTVTRSATVFNAFTRLIKPVERAHGLSIRYDAQALRLVWSPTERRVVAVICRDMRTGSEERIDCRAVVLAAGAINSAQILMESACADFPDGLGSSCGVLGRYLHDHPLAKLVIDLGRRVSSVPASYFTRPPLDRSAPLYAAALMQWSGAGAFARSVLSGRPEQANWLGFSVFGTMEPTADNFIALDRSKRSSGARSPLLLALRHPAPALSVLEAARDEVVAVLARAGWEPKAPRARRQHRDRRKARAAMEGRTRRALKYRAALRALGRVALTFAIRLLALVPRTANGGHADPARLAHAQRELRLAVTVRRLAAGDRSR